ncbi:hypothetical protein Q4E93_16090 [Flavitalea sp. BT771]|uniref:hypothetical protein n=1 Tax=Flavitalea sp. BT771 TaxID=3063329 RepID=UPI0026E28424|nr:hypothetical protein [Flavitalea sp. BT771]MDO6432124.1 hypothetical protein [Flavitalea sp. BT771]MDV6221033.1 hypothetical protein [Flavitalea sp. BT771]
MNAIDTIELRNIDPDDISDVLVKIEKSFGLNLATDSFKNARTFGDICDIISSSIELEHADDCTTQQAFYKIRESIAKIQFLGKNTITPNSDLEGLIPRKRRRHIILKIRKESGLSLKILDPKGWISVTLFFGLLASLIEFFFNWKYGFLDLGTIIIGYQLAGWFGKEFRVKTIGEAAAMAAREDYLKSRRNQKTVNRQEIVKKIKELFSHDLDLDLSVLSQEAPLF